jgi:hypothetical protein
MTMLILKMARYPPPLVPGLFFGNAGHVATSV